MENHADIYFQTLRDCGALKHLFPEIMMLIRCALNARISSSGVDYTLMSLQQACKSNYSLDVRFAVLVHDLGKALTQLKNFLVISCMKNVELSQLPNYVNV